MNRIRAHGSFVSVMTGKPINGFAGSDLRFFHHFEQLFEDAHTLPVATNYRSAQSIVDVGNALMRGQGTPACAP